MTRTVSRPHRFQPAPDRVQPRSLRLGTVLSLRIRRRSVVVVAALLAFVVLLGCVALTLGEFVIPIDQLLAAFTVDGSPAVQRILLEWRMPRVLLAVLGGAALGVSGAVFQSITRNPLGSPDIIGFNSGAYAGALVVIVVLGGDHVQVAFGAVAGGLVAAFLVYVLAFRRGVQGFRLIVVGIAVGAVLDALNSWMIVTASLDVAIGAASWGAGDLGLTAWRDVIAVAVVVILAIPVLIVLAPPLRQLELGDDAAQALGVRPERTRLMLLVVGVALVAVVTAFAGPIVFVALAAPQLARRLARSPGVTLVPSAAMGSAMLLVSDVLAQRIIAPSVLPVGVVTAVLGGTYLIGLLIAQSRKA